MTTMVPTTCLRVHVCSPGTGGRIEQMYIDCHPGDLERGRSPSPIPGGHREWRCLPVVVGWDGQPDTVYPIDPED